MNSTRIQYSTYQQNIVTACFPNHEHKCTQSRKHHLQTVETESSKLERVLLSCRFNFFSRVASFKFYNQFCPGLTRGTPAQLLLLVCTAPFKYIYLTMNQFLEENCGDQFKIASIDCDEEVCKAKQSQG